MKNEQVVRFLHDENLILDRIARTLQTALGYKFFYWKVFYLVANIVRMVTTSTFASRRSLIV
jgi:hypothetical protein